VGQNIGQLRNMSSDRSWSENVQMVEWQRG